MMSMSGIGRHIEKGDGEVAVAALDIIKVREGYEEGSIAARALDEALLAAMDALGELSKAHAKITSHFSLAEMALQSAIAKYGPEGAGLDTVDLPNADSTIDQTRLLLTKVQMARGEATTEEQGFKEGYPEWEASIRGLKDQSMIWHTILGVNRGDLIPGLLRAIKEQQNTSDATKQELNK
jgi:hypothetical protein